MELVSIFAEDGLELDGIWAPAISGGSTAVLHIHGKAGNFYHNRFLREIYKTLPARGFSVLGINTRGAGSILEGFNGQSCVYVGAAFEKIEHALIDIGAAVAWLRQRCDSVVLQGHSHGCEKIIYYSSKRDSIYPNILLSPADSASLHREFISPRTIEQQIEELTHRSAGPWGLISEDEYGVRRPNASYSIPVGKESLLELLTGPGLFLLDQESEARALASVRGKTLVLIGDRDSLQIPSSMQFAAFLRRGLPPETSTVELMVGGDHHFKDMECVVCDRICNWLVQL